MSYEQVIIFGCGGHSRSVADIILMQYPHVSLIFVDEHARADEKIMGHPVCSDISLNLETAVQASAAVSRLDGRPFFLAIGDNQRRKMLYTDICPLESSVNRNQLISVVSPLAHIGQQTFYGKGVFIGNFVHIGPEAIIGNNTIINNGAIIEHEVVIGKHSHVAPRAVIAGRTKIGDGCFIGAGACIKEGITICSDVIVGAGSVVIKDIIQPGTYVGSPVRRLVK